MAEPIWGLHRGEGPLVAAAIHDGHAVREELRQLLAIDDKGRLREEDPHTGSWCTMAPTRIVGLRSRFEVDLNRPRDSAVYRTPEDAWGLQVWRDVLPDEVAARSLEEYDDFYAVLESLYSELERDHGRFVVFDLHSYNHRREGPEGPEADPEGNPQVNVGTGTISDRALWAPVIERFMAELASFDFPRGALDVRENVRFRGGECARWTHEHFPGSACVLSIEVKKFFMDEWTGEADHAMVEAVGAALASTVPGVLQELGRL